MAKLSENSERSYTTYANLFLKFLDGREPTLDLGEEFLDSLEENGRKRNTRGVAGRAIRNKFGLKVNVPSIEMGEPRYHSIEDIKMLIEKAPTLLLRTIIIVVFSSACRISEILNLTLDDLELDKGVATVKRKGGRIERVALGKQGTEALQIWLKKRQTKSRRVFLDYTYQDIYYRFKQLGDAVGIPEFSPHRLRHSRVIHLRDSGADWPFISEVCGHTRGDTTLKIYGRRRAEERVLPDF